MDYKESIDRALEIDSYHPTTPDHKFAWNALEDDLNALDAKKRLDILFSAMSERKYTTAAMIILSMMDDDE